MLGRLVTAVLFIGLMAAVAPADAQGNTTGKAC